MPGSLIASVLSFPPLFLFSFYVHETPVAQRVSNCSDLPLAQCYKHTTYMESQCLCVAARMKVTRSSETLAEFEAIGISEFVHCIWPHVSDVVYAVPLYHVHGNQGGCQRIRSMLCACVHVKRT